MKINLQFFLNNQTLQLKGPLFEMFIIEVFSLKRFSAE